ncbi:uncharacterized protein LOC129922950 isoform X1 [Biomphalaria glabrata]|uniref:Uncharacterized protein LOC129922950 isoform X1 n=1 Tax=Biomphalaria glabrata TaxID=6526 RepID=A0A9W2YXA2_BIOGL|nr:uncharacterized protein LOC129922950 isoform X1 [Biomphalaria glabrata]
MKVLFLCAFANCMFPVMTEAMEICRPAEETKVYSFGFVMFPSMFGLSEFQIMKNKLVMSIGDEDLQFIDYFKTSAKTDVFRESDGNVSVKLTIKSVTRRDQGMWSTRYLHNGRSLYSPELSCYLKTFVKPQDILCHSKVNGGRFDINCSTNKVFPEAACVAQFSKDIGNRLASIDHTHEIFVEGTSSYFRTACHVSIDISNTSLNDVHVNITMYPNVTNTLQDLNFGEVKSMFYKLISADYHLINDYIELKKKSTYMTNVSSVNEAEHMKVNRGPLESSKTYNIYYLITDTPPDQTPSESLALVKENTVIVIAFICLIVVLLGFIVHKLVICKKLRKHQNDKENHFYEVIDSIQ